MYQWSGIMCRSIMYSEVKYVFRFAFRFISFPHIIFMPLVQKLLALVAVHFTPVQTSVIGL